MARERKLYIESQGRRVLERRGVDTKDGVGGGVGAEGRRMASGEVKGLEGLFGKKEKKGGGGGEGLADGGPMDLS